MKIDTEPNKMNKETVKKDNIGSGEDQKFNRFENKALLNEETLFSVLEELPIGVFIADNSGQIIYGNKAGSKIWSGLKYVPPDKYTEYRGWWCDTGKEIAADEWALNRALTNAQVSRDEEIEIECFDGTHKIILNSAYPLFDDNGQICGGFATNQDITEKRAAERESRHLAEFPLQNPFPVLQIDGNNKVLYSNAPGVEVLDTLGLKEGKREYTPWSDTIKRVLHSKKMMNDEIRIDRRFLSFSFVPVSDDKVNVYGLDITDRRQAEEKLLQEKEHLQVLINGTKNSHLVYLDRDFNFVHVNKVYAETCGYEPEEMIGKNHFDLYPNDENMAIFTRVRDTGEPFEIRDKPFEFPDQPERGVTYWDWTLTPVRDKEGNVIGLIFSLFETTERKRTDEAIARTHRLESLGNLAAGIAHDFNNLLAGIYGSIDLAMSENIPNKVAKTLAQAASTINQARGITQQLITFAKGGSPRLEVHDVVESVKSLVRSTIRNSDSIVEFIIPEPVRWCRFDSGQFEQVMQSLIQNALQAMPEKGRITIAITNCRIDADSVKNLARGNYVRVSVSDTGTGISDDIRHHIFDPFFTTRELGRGLGLTTSYSIISRHGGTIEVEPNAPKGTTFHVYLPAIDEDNGDNEKDGLREMHRKVLLMDDEELVLMTTAQLLKKLDFQVTIARNGEEARKEFIAAKNTGVPFSLAILDLTIRYGWGGIRTLEEIRKLDTEIPVIIASGYADDPVMAKPKQFGFTYSIRKPFNMLELSELVKKIVTKK